MFRLARLFLGMGRGDSSRGIFDLDLIESRLREALAQSRAAWPGLPVDETSFITHLGQCIPAATDPLDALTAMNVRDLYLARACLDEIPGAAVMFERLYRPVIAKYLARTNASQDLVQEVTQAVLARALVCSPDGSSTLAEYQGRSTLAHFIGIAAQHRALDNRRADQAQAQLLARLMEQPPAPERGPEQSLLREKYRIPFATALRAAIEQLTGRERVVMRLHLVGRLSTGRIAKMYNVNQATVSRWLTRSRRAIWADVQLRLQQEFGFAAQEVESLMQSVGSQMDISLSAALATKDHQQAV